LTPVKADIADLARFFRKESRSRIMAATNSLFDNFVGDSYPEFAGRASWQSVAL
jgi:hypothetical protein